MHDLSLYPDLRMRKWSSLLPCFFSHTIYRLLKNQLAQFSHQNYLRRWRQRENDETFSSLAACLGLHPIINPLIFPTHMENLPKYWLSCLTIDDDRRTVVRKESSRLAASAVLVIMTPVNELILPTGNWSGENIGSLPTGSCGYIASC